MVGIRAGGAELNFARGPLGNGSVVPLYSVVLAYHLPKGEAEHLPYETKAQAFCFLPTGEVEKVLLVTFLSRKVTVFRGPGSPGLNNIEQLGQTT